MNYKFTCFYEFLNNMVGKEYFQNFIIYNTSLVNAGLKPATTLNMIKNTNKNTYDLWLKYGEEILENMNLNYIRLRENNTLLVMLIYNRQLLESCLNKKDNKRFLSKLGYNKNDNIDNRLNKLQDNYAKYNCPHELGIFLGYPVEDVDDFMNNTTKECLACGYWKVYNNYEHAKDIFRLYDKAKEFAIDNIIKGNEQLSLAPELKNLFCAEQI